jgi:plasmid stability protein
MKNVTISLDDASHRRARIRAAERGQSLSALVRDLLVGEVAGGPDDGSDERNIRETLAALRERVPKDFKAGDRLSRDEIYDRRR